MITEQIRVSPADFATIQDQAIAIIFVDAPRIPEIFRPVKP